MQALKQEEFVLQPKPSEVIFLHRPTVDATVDTAGANHHKAMIRFGLIGTALGAIVGSVLVPQIPRSEAMYTVILPITTTYIGLALGFFTAGVRKRVAKEGNSQTTFGSDSSELKVFGSYEEARQGFESLVAGGVQPKQMTIVGTDSDELRSAITPLVHHRLDRLIVILGAIGAICGAYWGTIGAPHLSPSLPSVIMSAIMATFCGGLLGLLTGTFIGGILHVDNLPNTDAAIVEGSIANGVVAVVVNSGK